MAEQEVHERDHRWEWVAVNSGPFVCTGCGFTSKPQRDDWPTYPESIFEGLSRLLSS